MPHLQDALVILLPALLTLYFYVYRRNARRLPLPPGPKGLPLIGNLWTLPSPANYPWETYHKWCKEFGTDILYLNAAGTPMVILDTSEAATALLETKSSIYSDRTKMTMVTDLMGWDFSVGFMGYGERWRESRKLMHESFHPTASHLFRPQELKATHGLLRRILDNPDDFSGHLHHLSGEIVIGAAYGIQVQEKDDPYIKMADITLASINDAGIPGTFLVDLFPMLKYVPEWFPGAGFQTKAREGKKLTKAMINAPFEAAKRQVKNRTAPRSLASNCLQKIEDGTQDKAYREDVIKGAAGTLYAAANQENSSVLGAS